MYLVKGSRIARLWELVQTLRSHVQCSDIFHFYTAQDVFGISTGGKESRTSWPVQGMATQSDKKKVGKRVGKLFQSLNKMKLPREES
jgi:hypothetical protein